MAEFEALPCKIQKLAAQHFPSCTVRFCALAGSKIFQPDFILLTNHRLLILTEQTTLGLYSFSVITSDLSFDQIRSLSIEQTLWQKITWQSQLKIETSQSISLINGLNLRDAKEIIHLIP